MLTRIGETWYWNGEPLFPPIEPNSEPALAIARRISKEKAGPNQATKKPGRPKKGQETQEDYRNANDETWLPEPVGKTALE